MSGLQAFPRIMLTAPSSGGGKTFLTCALIAALKKRGLNVRAFKCGPDFIDPLFHKKVLGEESINLDSYFLPDSRLEDFFKTQNNESSIAVIEGVMGYFDGLGGVSLKASSADISRITKTPVILCVDCHGQSRSAAAVVKGFCELDSEKNIAAVILNQVPSNLEKKLPPLIEELSGIPVLGCIPKLKEGGWQSRHLGLLLPDEIDDFKNRIDRASDVFLKNINMELLLSIANRAEKLPKAEDNFLYKNIFLKNKKNIAVAYDEAFCFYYKANLNAFKNLGCSLQFFSPLKDSRLPNADCYVFGGGYPELFAQELSENESMAQDIFCAVKNGSKVLAECGGFLYLQQFLSTKEGQKFKMVGAIKGESFYAHKLIRFGYAEYTNCEGKKFHSIKGHEFHYFESTNNGSAFFAQKASTGEKWKSIVSFENTLAGFPHLYYDSCPEFIADFLEQ